MGILFVWNSQQTEEMSRYFLLFAFLTVSFLVLSTFAYQEDEYYCQSNKESKICHRCSDLESDCPRKQEETDCRCDNTAINNGSQFLGGAKCDSESDYGDPYCYVREDSNCEDKEENKFATESPNVWIKGKVYISQQACEEGQLASTGNEELLEGFQIISPNDTLNFNDSETKEALKFNFLEQAYEDWKESEGFKTNYTKWLKKEKNSTESIHTHCEWQCARRNGKKSVCGAWSFDKAQKICHLYYVTACCGQLDKREPNKDFVSGYVCPHCWSTRNKCPCNNKKLEEKPADTAHSKGGSGGGGTTFGGYRRKK